jgi:hypothetical protein
MSGGAADPRNNVERVIVENPALGEWTVQVRGTSVPDGPQGYAVVANGGIRRLPDRIRAPDEHPKGRLAFRLEPPYPNPFVGGAELRFRAPSPVRVTIRVYDVTGKLVRTVLDRPVIGGNHTVRWNGRDEDGRPVAPGLYLLRLTAPGIELNEKGVRLR